MALKSSPIESYFLTFLLSWQSLRRFDHNVLSLRSSASDSSTLHSIPSQCRLHHQRAFSISPSSSRRLSLRPIQPSPLIAGLCDFIWRWISPRGGHLSQRPATGSGIDISHNGCGICRDRFGHLLHGHEFYYNLREEFCGKQAQGISALIAHCSLRVERDVAESSWESTTL